MPQESVEVVRRSFEAFARGDFETAFAAHDPDTEWHTAADEPDSQTYRGIDGLHRLVAALSELWLERFGGQQQPTMLRVYSVSSLSQRPTERCDLRSAPNSRIESPSWSPDGDQLAWSERDGIWVSPIADGAGDCGAAPRRLIAGGSQPDWGPANAPR